MTRFNSARINEEDLLNEEIGNEVRVERIIEKMNIKKQFVHRFSQNQWRTKQRYNRVEESLGIGK